MIDLSVDVDTSYSNKTCLRYSSVSYSDFYNTEGKHVQVDVKHAKNGYYSENVSTMEFIRRKWHQTHRQNELHLKKNYRIENGIAQLVSLGDLFDEEVNLDETLKSIITDLWTKSQNFGLECINSEAIFSGMKQNFHIVREGIVFYYMNRKEEAILVPKEKLMPYLKDKKMFD